MSGNWLKQKQEHVEKFGDIFVQVMGKPDNLECKKNRYVPF